MKGERKLSDNKTTLVRHSFLWPEMQNQQRQPNCSVREHPKVEEDYGYGLHPQRQREVDSYSCSVRPARLSRSYSSRYTFINPEPSQGAESSKQKFSLRLGTSQLSRFSNLVASRGTSKYNVSDKHEWSNNAHAVPESYRNGPVKVKKSQRWKSFIILLEY